MAEMKKRGGARPGAGRPRGSRNVLAFGEVGALKTLRKRVPEDASEEDKALADRARDTIVNVMLGRTDYRAAPTRLMAARYIREEICGPCEQKVQHEAKGGFSITIVTCRLPKSCRKHWTMAQRRASQEAMSLVLVLLGAPCVAQNPL